MKPITVMRTPSRQSTSDSSGTPADGASVVPTADALWSEMQEVWERGDSLCASDLFDRHPQLLEDESVSVDLIYAEFVLEERRMGRADTSGYLRRYGQFAAPLARQFEFHTEFEKLGTEPAAHPDALECPGEFGKYYLLCRIAKGGQSEVYRAVHRDLSVEVALKIGPSQDSAPELADRLYSEGRLLAELQHPHIVRVTDAGVEQNRPYVVTELVRGITLADYAGQNEIDVPLACRVVEKLANAVAAAHRRGILHLDLKPQNVVVSADGEPRLIDFGIGRELVPSDFDEERGVLSGTLRFMAPEQAKRQAESVGYATDVFGLGAILYFLVVGDAPIPKGEFPAMLKSAQRGVAWRRSLEASPAPQRMKEIVARALAAEPSQRIPSAEALEQALSSYREAATRRRPAIALATLAGFVICIAGVAGAYWALAGGEDERAAHVASSTPSESNPVLTAEVLEEGRFHHLQDMLPLRDGDQIRIRVESAGPGQRGLFLIESDGTVESLHTEAATSTTGISFPPAGDQVVPAVNGSGLEVLLYCEGPAVAELATMVPGLCAGAPWPDIPDQTFIRLTDRGPVIEQQSMGFGAAESVGGSVGNVTERLEDLRLKLSERGIRCTGIAYLHVP